MDFPLRLRRRSGPLASGVVGAVTLVAWCSVVEAGLLSVSASHYPEVTNSNSGTSGPVFAAVGVDGPMGAKARADYGAVGASSWVESVGRSGATASWQDTLTVTGAVVGELVEFVITMRVDGELVAPSDTLSNGYSQMASWLWGLPLDAGETGPCHGAHLGAPSFTGCNAAVYRSESNYYASESAGDLVTTKRVALVVGQTYTVYQALVVGSQFDRTGFATTSANFYGTASFNLDPVSSEYGYTAGSGTDYRTATSVPEPASTAVLFATGLAGLAGVARRRRWR